MASSATAAEFPAASRPKRVIAGLIDLFVCFVVLSALFKMPTGPLSVVKSSGFFRIARFIPIFYMLLRDSIGGKSIGKLIVGLTVYEVERRRPANMLESIIRNWPFATLPIFYVFSMLSAWLPFGWIKWIGDVMMGLFILIIGLQVLFGAKRRMGDGSAGTQVIEDHWLAKF